MNLLMFRAKAHYFTTREASKSTARGAHKRCSVSTPLVNLRPLKEGG